MLIQPAVCCCGSVEPILTNADKQIAALLWTFHCAQPPVFCSRCEGAGSGSVAFRVSGMVKEEEEGFQSGLEWSLGDPGL